MLIVRNGAVLSVKEDGEVWLSLLGRGVYQAWGLWAGLQFCINTGKKVSPPTSKSPDKNYLKIIIKIKYHRNKMEGENKPIFDLVAIEHSQVSNSLFLSEPQVWPCALQLICRRGSDFRRRLVSAGRYAFGWVQGCNQRPANSTANMVTKRSSSHAISNWWWWLTCKH